MAQEAGKICKKDVYKILKFNFAMITFYGMTREIKIRNQNQKLAAKGSKAMP